jgi:hypothetical protein
MSNDRPYGYWRDADDWDSEWESAKQDAKYDEVMEGFSEWCEENDLDSDDPDVLDEWYEAKTEQKNPLAYRGMSMRDFYNGS